MPRRRATAVASPATLASGPVVEAGQICFSLPDADRRLAGVRLAQDVRIPGHRLDFTWTDPAWILRVDLPPVDRIEYKFDIAHADGGRESVTDPGNPLTAPGAFGAKSVLELAGYLRPWWLDHPAPAGRTRGLDISTRSLRGGVHASLWSPPDTEAEEPLALLVAHDG